MEPERENSETDKEPDTPSAPSQPPGGSHKSKEPQQLSPSRRLQGVEEQGTEEERFNQLDFENIFQILTAEGQGGAQGQAGGESSQSTPGCSPFWKEVITEATRRLPPSPSREISAEDIERQKRRLKRAREKLAEAFEAYKMAKEVERMCDQERAENQVETGASTAGGSAGERGPPKSFQC